MHYLLCTCIYTIKILGDTLLYKINTKTFFFFLHLPDASNTLYFLFFFRLVSLHRDYKKLKRYHDHCYLTLYCFAHTIYNDRLDIPMLLDLYYPFGFKFLCLLFFVSKMYDSLSLQSSDNLARR